MRITVLAGGYGGARFVRGLLGRLGPEAEVTVIGNTADDIVLFGLHISPDLDTLMYTLGDGLDEDRGWGRRDEAWRVREELAAYKFGPNWFGLGDRDLATHLVRTQLLQAGYPLHEVTAALCERWQPGVTLLPMTNERVETHVIVDGSDGGQQAMHFQQWWVEHRAALPARQFVPIGAAQARPAPGVLEALADCDLVVLPPSNPVVSIGMILAVPGIRAALQACPGPVVAVSPIIGGAPVRGMADACLSAIGVPVSAAGVALHYGSRSERGLLDGWLLAEQDAQQLPEVRAAGITARAVPLRMGSAVQSAALAGQVLELAGQIRAGAGA